MLYNEGMTEKAGTANREALAQAIARKLVQAWGVHLAGRVDGFKITIHVQPGQTQARIEWPPPLDDIKLNK